MKRFWTDVAVEAAPCGFLVTLDGRAVKTQGGAAQVLPTRALADALAAEWAAQGDPVDPAGFVFRDLADFAIDAVAPRRDDTLAGLLRYAETDTLCYRADPDDALRTRQETVWEPLVAAAEARWDLHLPRIAGVVHQRVPAPSLARLCRALDAENAFVLAALTSLASLAASLIVALAAAEPGADAPALFAAAELEADWQAEQWGQDWEAQDRRDRRLAAFAAASRFAALARG